MTYSLVMAAKPAAANLLARLSTANGRIQAGLLVAALSTAACSPAGPDTTPQSADPDAGISVDRGRAEAGPIASPGEADAGHPATDALDATVAADTPAMLDASADAAAPTDGAIPVTWNAGVATLEIVSPATCTLRFGRLGSCAIAPLVLDAPEPLPAGLVYTEMRARFSGDCSTQFPITIRADAPDALGRTFDLHPNRIETIQRRDGTALSSVTLMDGGRWLKNLFVGADCRVYLDVRMNIADGPLSVDGGGEDAHAGAADAPSDG